MVKIMKMIFILLMLMIVGVTSTEISSTCDHTSPLQELITDNLEQHEVDFKDHTVDDDNICLLVEALEKNPKWRKLNLWNNDLGAESAVYINKILQKSKLFYLHLGTNSLGSEGIRQLNALRHNRHLTELDLWNNRLGDRGIDFLAKILPTTCLQTLNLGVNGIGYKGCRLLFRNLPPTLYELNLYANRIDQSCLSVIVTAIRKGHLKVLNLQAQSDVFWNIKSKKELVDVAKENGCLVKI